MLPWLGVMGMAGLAATIGLGFEEPNVWMLAGSAILLGAGPAALLAHLALDGGLAPEERRAWWLELTGPRAARAFAAYLSSPDRGATARAFAANAGGSGSGRRPPLRRSP